MKVLVTGADGFVGEHLVAELLANGYDVAGSTLSLPPVRDTLTPDEASSIDWKAADIRDHDALVRLISAVRPEHIYHLAGFASGALARENAALSLNVNAGGTVNLFEAVLSVRDDSPEFNPRILVMEAGTHTETLHETACLCRRKCPCGRCLNTAFRKLRRNLLLTPIAGLMV